MSESPLNVPSDDIAVPVTSPIEATTSGSPFVIPGYELVKELGHCGMGVVFQARDLTLNRIVAVKIMLDLGPVTPEQLARFQVEAQAIAQLQHPHIVQIFTSGTHEQRPYFVMEYVEGGTLATKLNGQAQPPREAARLVLLLARAMNAAHRKQIIHRDLKPANILIAPTTDEPALNTIYGCPKITDFGLAKDLQSNHAVPSNGRVMGTVKYMAPEQVEGDTQAVGPSADIYALGVILYEMLTGRPPFLGASEDMIARLVLLANPVPLASIRAGIPHELETICLRCLAKKPADRFPSAAALADALQHYLEEPRPEVRAVATRTPVDLQMALRSVEPAAVLVSARVLQNIIRQAGSNQGLTWSVPHSKSFIVDRQTLFRHVDQDQLAIGPDQLLPMTVLLIAWPEPEELEAADNKALLTKYWRRLFHSSIHLALDNRWADGKLNVATLRERIDQLGHACFEEIRTVLVEDRYLGPDPDDRSTYTEFAAVFLELQFFAPHLLPTYFPSLRDLAGAYALLCQDVEAAVIYQKTRLPGASEPARLARTSHSVEAHEYFAKLVRQSEEAMQQGNVVLAAIQRRRAARMAPTAQAYATRQDAVAKLLGLVDRLRKPLLLSDTECEQWCKHLPALLDKSDQGKWPVEAALLYELQKVCLDNEREIYALDMVEWLLSGGRRPIKRPLPGQRLVRVARTLASAAQRLTLARLSDDDRNQFADLFQDAVRRSEDQVRERFRPLLTGALHDVGLQPRHPLEATALSKVVEEVLDRVIASGFITFSELRDILSRSQLKLPDLSGPPDFIRGDPLLRLDRRLSTLLDGVYRPSEFYVRCLERFTALNFGTPLGRLVTLYVTVPFVGSFALVQAITILMHYLNLAEPPPAIHYTIGILLGFVLMAVLHSATVRERGKQVAHSVGRPIRLLFVHGPLWLIRHPSLKTVIASWPFQICYWYALKPLVVTALAWFFMPAELHTLFAMTGVFLMAMFFINSGPGEAFNEGISQVLSRFTELLRGGLIPSLFNLVKQLFKRILHMGEALLFAVDEWLRFRGGDSRLVMITRAFLSVLWFPVAYVIRFNVVVLIEPALNPLKLPIASIATKFMLPMLGVIEQTLSEVCTPVLGTVLGKALTWWIVFWLPDAVAFIIWEMKENWSLYRANRRQTLGPVGLGQHGETLRALFAPGFHSGTIPRLYARLRSAERHARQTGNYSGVRACVSALAEVEHALNRFMTREFCELLGQTPAWNGPAPRVVRVHLGINQIHVELCHPSVADQSMSVEFEYRASLIIAGVTLPAWLATLTPEQQVVLHNALVVLYKLAGVDLIRDEIDPTNPRLGQIPISWEQCVACWQVGSATRLGDELRLAPVNLSSRPTNMDGTVRVNPESPHLV